MTTHTTPPLQFAILATDVAVFTVKNNQLYVRLMIVDRPPHFKNQPGLPGGLIGVKETAEEAAKRVLTEKSGIDTKKIYIEQLYTFSRLDRDPRGRVVAVGYLGLVPFTLLTPAEQTDTSNAYWLEVTKVKKLAYDHDEVLLTALTRLRSRVRYTTLINKLLPKEFTLTQLEEIYEAIISTKLDKRNFRKKILKLNILEETGEKRLTGAFRPAALYRFISSKVQDIEVL